MIATECRSALVHDAGFLAYDFGPSHPLRPERITAGLDLLKRANLWSPDSTMPDPKMAADEELQLVHDVAYIEAVRCAGTEWCPQDVLSRFGLSQADNPAFPGMHEAASLVAGGTIAAIRQILKGDLDHAFNPAGGLHHALQRRASGFCIYNDPALAAAVATREFGARVMYVDVDCHHGDGVQWLFYDDPRVLTVSFHESGQYLFPGTGDVDEVGQGAGLGYAVNVPMAPFTRDGSWLEALDAIVPPLADRFRPDVIVSAHGADTHVWDPLTHLELTTRSFVGQAELLHQIAHTYSAGRWLAVGSGGYDWRRVVPRSWAILWAEMTGQRDRSITLPVEWVNQWERGADKPMPHTLLDEDTVYTPAVRDAEIARLNQETVRNVREVHRL
jgi:acetoin utilization protein AcuC